MSLCDWLTRRLVLHKECRVRWHNVHSASFMIQKNGTTQGNVLSPYLFSRYIRGMLGTVTYVRREPETVMDPELQPKTTPNIVDLLYLTTRRRSERFACTCSATWRIHLQCVRSRNMCDCRIYEDTFICQDKVFRSHCGEEAARLQWKYTEKILIKQFSFVNCSAGQY